MIVREYVAENNLYCTVYQTLNRSEKEAILSGKWAVGNQSEEARDFLKMSEFQKEYYADLEAEKRMSKMFDMPLEAFEGLSEPLK